MRSTLTLSALFAFVIVERVTAFPVVPKIFFLDRLIHHHDHADHGDDDTEAHFDYTPDAPEPLGTLDDYDDYHFVDESRHKITPEYENELAARAALVDHEAHFLGENEYRAAHVEADAHWEPAPAHGSHGFDPTLDFLKDVHHDHANKEKGTHNEIVYLQAKPFGKPAPVKTTPVESHSPSQNSSPDKNGTASEATLGQSGDHSVYSAKLFDVQTNGTASSGVDGGLKHGTSGAPDTSSGSTPAAVLAATTTFSTDPHHFFDREKGKV